MNIKKHIPNAITCGNLFCGCLAIVSAFNGNLVASAYLVGIAAVLDFFDGFAARILKVSGELGKQLDSLADMVTFGVVPGVVMFQLLGQAWWGMHMDGAAFNPELNAHLAKYYPYIAFIPFLITIFSAIRLAKFNIDTRQTNSFIGVPTPANSILICSLPLIQAFQSTLFGFDFNAIITNVYFLLGLSILMSYLLVAELPLFALKFKNFGWADNKLRFSFLIISVLLIALLHFVAIPFIIFLYIVLSVINNMYTKNKI